MVEESRNVVSVEDLGAHCSPHEGVSCSMSRLPMEVGEAPRLLFLFVYGVYAWGGVRGMAPCRPA
eukprot:3689888-Prorocentrum_lima.AAC.1